jgi:ribosome-binding protein aMBF1 (putative translation factor)
MSEQELENQDWTPVVIRSKTAKKPAEPISHEIVSNVNKAKKLENSDDTGTFKKLSNESRQTLVQARVAKNLKQDDLARALNMPANIYKAIENGKSIPTQQDLNKINNYLKTSLKLQ